MGRDFLSLPRISDPLAAMQHGALLGTVNRAWRESGARVYRVGHNLAKLFALTDFGKTTWADIELPVRVVGVEFVGPEGLAGIRRVVFSRLPQATSLSFFHANGRGQPVSYELVMSTDIHETIEEYAAMPLEFLGEGERPDLELSSQGHYPLVVRACAALAIYLGTPTAELCPAPSEALLTQKEKTKRQLRNTSKKKGRARERLRGKIKAIEQQLANTKNVCDVGLSVERTLVREAAGPRRAHLVRGHIRNQAYGPRMGLRRRIYVHPHIRCAGEVWSAT